MGSPTSDQRPERNQNPEKDAELCLLCPYCTFGTAFTQEFSEDGQLDDQRTWNGNTNFNNLGNFGNFGNLFTNQNIGTWYALLGALLLVPLLLAIPVLAGGGGLGALFGNRRQSFLNRVAQQGNNNRPQTFVPTVGESLLLAYIQSASDLYGPMLQG